MVIIAIIIIVVEALESTITIGRTDTIIRIIIIYLFRQPPLRSFGRRGVEVILVTKIVY